MKLKLWLSNVEDHPAFRNIKLSTCSATWTDFINIGFSENVRDRTSFIAHFMTIKSIYIGRKYISGTGYGAFFWG